MVTSGAELFFAAINNPLRLGQKVLITWPWPAGTSTVLVVGVESQMRWSLCARQGAGVISVPPFSWRWLICWPG